MRCSCAIGWWMGFGDSVINFLRHDVLSGSMPWQTLDRCLQAVVSTLVTISVWKAVSGVNFCRQLLVNQLKTFSNLAPLECSPSPGSNPAPRRIQSKRQREFDICFVFLMLQHNCHEIRTWKDPRLKFLMQTSLVDVTIRISFLVSNKYSFFSFRNESMEMYLKVFFRTPNNKQSFGLQNVYFAFEYFSTLMSFWSAFWPPFSLVSFLLMFFFRFLERLETDRSEHIVLAPTSEATAMCYDV